MCKVTYYNLRIFNSNKFYKILIYCIIFLLVVFQLIDLNVEYDTTCGNTILHAEKMIIPDARAFYLKGNQKVEDYVIPFSTAYGVLGPKIVQFGFYLFGMNNYGLRVNFVLLSGIATAALVSSLLRIIPDKVGFLLALFYVCNYKQFILTRYAIIENIAILFLIAITWLYLFWRDFFVKKINVVIFVCGSLIFFKLNFPFYCCVLIIMFAIVEKFSLKKLIILCFWSVVGIFFFACLQTIVLYETGLLSIYIENVSRIFYSQSGHVGKYQILQTFTPPGILKILPKYLDYLSLWFIKIPFSDIFPNASVYNGLKTTFLPFVYIGAILSGIIFLIIIFFLYKRKNISKITLSFGLFLFLNLVIASQFHIHILRIIPFFPITILFFASIYNDILGGIFNEQRKVLVKQIALIIVTILLIYKIPIQMIYIYKSYPNIRSHAVTKNSQQLDVILPGKSTIFMQCYGMRFFWQTHNRIISGEDTFHNNQSILDMAIKDHGEYVLLTDIHIDPINVRKGYNLKMLKEFYTGKSDSYVPYNYKLYEIIRSTKVETN